MPSHHGRMLDTVAMRDIATKLRPKVLAQAYVRNRLFILAQSEDTV